MNLIITGKQEPHPLFIKHNIDAVPFKHPEMDTWRNNFQGVSYIDENVGLNFMVLSMMWVRPDGELILSDVKSTSKNILTGKKRGKNTSILKDTKDN